MDVPKIPPPESRSPHCASVAEMLSRIGDKWTILVVGLLQERSWRFNEMKRQIGVSQQMLTRTLKALNRDGIVVRTVTAALPPQVSYELTPLGISLTEPLAQVGMWVLRHLDAIEANRIAFDSAANAPAPRVTQDLPTTSPSRIEQPCNKRSAQDHTSTVFFATEAVIVPAVRSA